MVVWRLEDAIPLTLVPPCTTGTKSSPTRGGRSPSGTSWKSEPNPTKPLLNEEHLKCRHFLPHRSPSSLPRNNAKNKTKQKNINTNVSALNPLSSTCCPLLCWSPIRTQLREAWYFQPFLLLRVDLKLLTNKNLRAPFRCARSTNSAVLEILSKSYLCNLSPCPTLAGKTAETWTKSNYNPVIKLQIDMFSLAGRSRLYVFRSLCISVFVTAPLLGHEILLWTPAWSSSSLSSPYHHLVRKVSFLWSLLPLPSSTTAWQNCTKTQMRKTVCYIFIPRNTQLAQCFKWRFSCVRLSVTCDGNSIRRYRSLWYLDRRKVDAIWIGYVGTG